MIKTTRSPNKSAPSNNNGNKPASGKNNINNKVGLSDNGVEYTKKSKKLKSQKLAKF